MARQRQQPQGEVLQAHSVGAPAARTTSQALGSHCVRHHQRSGGRVTLLHRLASMLRWIFRRDTVEQALDDELRAYVEMAAGDRMRDGVPADEARRQALLELGGLEQAKEQVRSRRHGAWLGEMA